MRSHLAEGGLILAATHSTLGLGGGQYSVHELSLDQTNPPPFDFRAQRQEQRT
jgi:hypothetical protein